MGLVIDKALGRELIHEHAVTLAASDPLTTKEGLIYFNTSDSTLYIYYGGAWIAIGTSDPAAALSNILLETGDNFLLETGDYLLTE